VIAVERGTPMLPMLDSFAADIRSNNQRKLLEKAAQKEVWMMIPVVFGILPAVTAVAVFPALTTLSQL
jgi:tight adherence protein C